MFDYDRADEIVKTIVNEFSPQMVIIFGSVARHEADDDSDLDLLVVMETDAPRHRRAVPIMRRLFKCRMDIDLIVITPDEFDSESKNEYSLISEIVNTGVVAFIDHGHE